MAKSSDCVQNVSVEVTDSTARGITPLPSVTMLWPPNHAMVPVTIAANAFDNGGGAIALTVSIASSELPDFDGDGHTIPDYVVEPVDDATGIIEPMLWPFSTLPRDLTEFLLLDVAENAA
jgi:hypothetical protein